MRDDSVDPEPPISHLGLFSSDTYPSPLSRVFSLPVKNPIEASVLLAEASLARKQRKTHTTFIPLMLNEMPQVGDLVGLDAEFVTLNEVTKTKKTEHWNGTVRPLGVTSISDFLIDSPHIGRSRVTQ